VSPIPAVVAPPRRLTAEEIRHLRRWLGPLSVAGFLAMVAGAAGLFMIRQFLAANPIGLGLQGLAVVVFLWARLTFGRRSFHLEASPTAGGLVTWGPYRWLRHPIYAASVWCCWAGAMTQPTPAGVALAGGVTLGAVTRLLCEETLVRARYPEYADYIRRTWRLVPFLF